LRASFFAPFPSSSVSFPSESLDLFGRTTMAPAASLPPWRRRFGSSADGGGGRLLSLESFRFYAYLRSFRLHRPGCNGHCVADALPPFCSLADTLPPFCSGGCFAAVVVLMITSDGCFAAVVGRVDALPPLSCCRSFAPLALQYLFAGSVVPRFVGSYLGLCARLCLLHFSCCCCLSYGLLPLAWWCSVSVLIPSAY
jgi:hypothetical protein